LQAVDLGRAALRSVAGKRDFTNTGRFSDMSDQATPQVRKPFWRRGLAGFLDFLTIFFVAGYVIASLAGGKTDDGFKLEGMPALALFAVIVLYFYLGWKVVGGTFWQRILGAR
jgi:hypothetical protein